MCACCGGCAAEASTVQAKGPGGCCSANVHRSCDACPRELRLRPLPEREASASTVPLSLELISCCARSSLA
jgi:hypothetical protein